MFLVVDWDWRFELEIWDFGFGLVERELWDWGLGIGNWELGLEIG